MPAANDRYMSDGGTAEGDLASPPDTAGAVTPSDTVDLANVSRYLYVGTGGHVVVTMKMGGDVTLKNLPNGALIPIRATRVKATGTTATDIVALD